MCDVDGAKQCTSAAGMGERLYLKLGFKWICDITADGDEEDSQGVKTGLLEYCPKSAAGTVAWYQLIFQWTRRQR